MQKAVPPRVNGVNQDSASVDSTAATPKPATKATLADWTANGVDNDVNGFFGGEKRQRGGRKKRKKNREEPTTSVQNWDDIYDPSRPNSYEEYKNSDEKILELRAWKDKLYAHRLARRHTSDSDSGEANDSGQEKSKSSFHWGHDIHLSLSRSIFPSSWLVLRTTSSIPWRLSAASTYNHTGRLDW